MAHELVGYPLVPLSSRTSGGYSSAAEACELPKSSCAAPSSSSYSSSSVAS
jgi:hypothetical protein